MAGNKQKVADPINHKKYFIQEHLHKKVFHGGIGNIDAERILLAQNYEPISFPGIDNFSVKAKIARSVYLVKTLQSIPSGSEVVFQFPLYANMHKMLVRMLSRRKNIRIICFIADINGLKDGDNTLLAAEIKELKRYHYFIVHNESMQRWLHQSVSRKRSAVLEFFDFLATVPDIKRVKANTVIFAGNLAKSGFLNDLQAWQSGCPNVQLNLYGDGYDASKPALKNVAWKGCLEPHELPGKLEGAFGLVWDGDSATGSKGSLGTYMQYISHHKLSLYIVSGLPVITAAWAASAEIVTRYNIGFAVNSLTEIENKIAAISDAAYNQMVANTRKLAPRIANGENLQRALSEL